ncbi:hypothetical protein N2W54_007982 [Lotmaria passim]
MLRAIEPNLVALVVPHEEEMRLGGAKAYLTEIEVRDFVLQFCIRETEKWAEKREQRAVQMVHFAVKRMRDFVKMCRLAVLRLQRQPTPLSAGFWAHRSVQPRVVARWKRCWAKTSVKKDALSLCYPGSVKTELHIPFASLLRCYRESRAAGAPPAFARNGLVFQLSLDNPPLLVVVCPELPHVCEGLLSCVREWKQRQSSPRSDAEGGDGKEEGRVTFSSGSLSQSPSQLTGAATRGVASAVRVWSLPKGAVAYEQQSWVVDGDALHMTSYSSHKDQTCPVADIATVVAEIELPVRPPVRTACGFMLCLRSGFAILAFAEHPQERAHLLERLYQSQLVLQLSAAST